MVTRDAIVKAARAGLGTPYHVAPDARFVLIKVDDAKVLKSAGSGAAKGK